MKERRTQLTASELQYLDKSQSGETVKNNERGEGSEPHHPDKFQASQSTEKSTSDGHHALHHPDGQHPDRGTKHEIHPNLDKGKSESFPNMEKGRAIFPPRTNSR